MANDSWQTPQPVFDSLDREFNFMADMAASKDNAMHPIFFTKEDDSLNLD